MNTHTIHPSALGQHLQSQPRTGRDGIEFSDLLAQLAALPPETPEERQAREKALAAHNIRQRIANFRHVCPAEFMQAIDRAQLKAPEAFDRVAQWTGAFPGPLATGQTGASKTRAIWSALCRLNVEHERSVAWFTAKRLITEFGRYESKGIADEFWRLYRGYDLLFIDDLDKYNAQFESEATILWQFYDWAYREHRPLAASTNKGRKWWAEKMGDAFARRLFDEAHYAVAF